MTTTEPPGASGVSGPEGGLETERRDKVRATAEAAMMLGHTGSTGCPAAPVTHRDNPQG